VQRCRRSNLRQPSKACLVQAQAPRPPPSSLPLVTLSLPEMTSEYRPVLSVTTQSTSSVPSPADSPTGRTPTSQRIFHQLQLVKQLQSDIATQHANLEGISIGPEGASTTISPEGGRTADTSEGGEGSKAGSGLGGRLGAGRTKEEKEKSAKSYESLAEEFDQRQRGVEGIMIKVLKSCSAFPSP
jgi:hypothetical protein